MPSRLERKVKLPGTAASDAPTMLLADQQSKLAVLVAHPVRDMMPLLAITYHPSAIYTDSAMLLPIQQTVGSIGW